MINERILCRVAGIQPGGKPGRCRGVGTSAGRREKERVRVRKLHGLYETAIRGHRRHRRLFQSVSGVASCMLLRESIQKMENLRPVSVSTGDLDGTSLVAKPAVRTITSSAVQ